MSPWNHNISVVITSAIPCAEAFLYNFLRGHRIDIALQSQAALFSLEKIQTIASF